MLVGNHAQRLDSRRTVQSKGFISWEILWNRKYSLMAKSSVGEFSQLRLFSLLRDGKGPGSAEPVSVLGG